MKLLATLFSLAALLAAPLVSAQTPAETAAPNLAKGAEGFAGVCAACHNADGNSTIPMYSKLAGQHPEYLLKQLHEFKSGKRVDPVMQGMASILSDEDMRDIAWWLASQTSTPGFAAEKDLVTEGERIYRGGIADRNIAACAGCHSPNGAGIPSQYPRLAGQHAEYTSKQLSAFRDGTRDNSIPMHQVAAKMNDREIRAVSDYIAGLR
ncbi:cytochrome c4 [Corticibacter populi]|uniref:Cytochrome c4 n=1 Tax=Corticibacter populi TaxID=1550736 RepID=A0A3M6QPL8_9BURK|nr:c-type cytochrome [Corticibacter populi]RMX04978.1 cytochrome c4 [Corticibacter populi]RZS33593.1 cytochrome c553 [Corticibacter populi]